MTIDRAHQPRWSARVRATLLRKACFTVQRCAAAILLLSLVMPAAAADFYSGKTFRIIGPWNGTVLVGQRIQLRELESDSNRGQVIGLISALDVNEQTFIVGPIKVQWSAKTAFRDIASADLRDGMLIKVSGRNGESAVLTATGIEPGPKDYWPADQVQITATVTETRPIEDGRVELKVLSAPVEMRRAGFNRIESLTLRQDSRRRDVPFTVDFYGRPLRITGEYDFTLRERGNYRLDNSSNRNLRDDQTHEFNLEFFLPYSDNTYVFVEGKAFYEADVYRSSGTSVAQHYFQRGQSWVYFDGMLRNHMGLQLGRQNVREVRAWWWDFDLDAARVYLDEGPFHAEVGLAKELGRFSTLQSGIDPNFQGVQRFFGNASWLWASRQTLELLWLNQRDRSNAQSVGSFIPREYQDPSDANLTWIGVRALGQKTFEDYGAMKYWLDYAWLTGDDRAARYSSNGTVTSVAHRDVGATALDVGLSYQTRLPARPSFTLGFARGSGDANVTDGGDGNYRQSSLQKNTGRFFGVTRFRYYGEILQPELANLNVVTAGVGLSLLNNSSVDLVYHRYWQSQAANSQRNVRIDAQPTGNARELGEELDLVFGFRDLRQWDFEIIGGMFKAGQAYGSLAGKTAYLLSFDVVFFF